MSLKLSSLLQGGTVHLRSLADFKPALQFSLAFKKGTPEILHNVRVSPHSTAAKIMNILAKNRTEVHHILYLQLYS